MIPLTLTEIAQIAGGAVHAGADVEVTGPAFIDTRHPEPGGLFVAFEGERVDGHDFAAAAIDAGAAAVLSTRPVDVPCVVVPDARQALARLAHHVIRKLPDTSVVALTGSQGKTSTKDLIAHVLSTAGTTVATVGSFNNELGFPLTVLRAEPATEYLVLEMGARGIGHIRALCEVAPPYLSLVLNVGKAHLGEFGSQQAIAQAKGEIVEALTEDGVAVLNADDPLVAAMAARTAATVCTYGTGADVDVRLEALTLDDLGRPRFDLVARGSSAHVEMRLVGEHHATNASAAAAAALALGLPLDAVAAALAGVTAISGGRMELHERADGVTVIDDAYNANPDSMRAGLKALAAIGRRRPEARTIAVLGEMLELGPASTDEHDAVGRLAVRLDIHRLLVVGEGARPIHLGASLEGSWGEESVFVPDNDAALDWLHRNLEPGDVVLFKASHGAELSRVARAVLADGVAS
ncbi:MAG TPA: UDP-N-acetylmuramoyl-tripeptide--D-alanyl-D-alanine ligase [Nocardioidaceae bacterium]|nr:UDP-N-acetylmuramoyl-tripeptide--D-alanyl-D-alanine ligase [Nocardioidaceae bacterium]